MDSEGEFNIPVKDKKHIQYNIVGTHLKNYDFMINLAHFKGHAMGGFGGVIKNQSIGVASSKAKPIFIRPVKQQRLPNYGITYPNKMLSSNQWQLRRKV